MKRLMNAMMPVFLVGTIQANVIYQNDFSTRVSESPVPSANWLRCAYVTGNISGTHDPKDGRAACLGRVLGDNVMQDGWHWAYDGNVQGESYFYRMANDGSDNKCATFINTDKSVQDATKDHRTFFFQSFQNELTNGVFRLSFDLRAFKFQKDGNCNLFVGPIYKKYLDFWWEDSLPKYAGLAGINLNRSKADVTDVYSYAYGGNGKGAGTYDGGFTASKLIQGNWYRFVVDFNADTMTMSGKVYAMGPTHPELDSTGTFMTDLHAAHFYADMTAETGGFAGIVIRDCGSVSMPDGTYTEAQAPMIDNLRCWWRASGTDFTADDLFYENDFVMRRSRTIQPVPQKSAIYQCAEKTVETRFSKYYYYTEFAKDTAAMANRLVMPPTNNKTVQPVSFDGMRLLNGLSTLSFFTFNIDKNPRMIGMRLMGNTNPYGIFAQHLGEKISSGKVRLSYDVRTPKSWIGSCPWIYGMLAPQEYYDSKDDDIQTTKYAFRAGFQGTANTETTKFAAIGSTTVTASDAKKNNWYRVVATCDFETKTFDTAIYDIGTSPIAMTAQVSGEPVFSKTGIALKNGSLSDVSCFALFLGGTPSMTLDGAIHVDNIRVWKQPVGGTDWAPLYSNDFSTRTRYNVKETSCRLTEMNDVMGDDGWIMRVNGLQPIAVSGGANPALRYDGNDTDNNDFSWVVQSIGRSIRKGKAKFRVDIKPPRVWTPGYDENTGVMIGLGDEQMFFGSRAAGNGSLSALNHYQIRFGIAPKATGPTGANYELNKYRTNKPFYFNQSGSRVYPADEKSQDYTFDWTHWYRFEATADVDAQTYALAAYDMGTTHPELTTATASGRLVFVRENLPFRMSLTDGRGLSTLAVCFEGCAKDAPWNAYDDGQVYVDNIEVCHNPPGLCIIVR